MDERVTERTRTNTDGEATYRWKDKNTEKKMLDAIVPRRYKIKPVLYIVYTSFCNRKESVRNLFQSIYFPCSFPIKQASYRSTRRPNIPAAFRRSVLHAPQEKNGRMRCRRLLGARCEALYTDRQLAPSTPVRIM